MIGYRAKGYRLAALFLLGAVLFNYPILSLANLNRMVWGIPLLYFYLFSVWGLLILLMVLVTRRKSKISIHKRRYPDKGSNNL